MDHIWWDFSSEGQNGGNNDENMMYDYGLYYKELGEHFLVLTLSDELINSSCWSRVAEVTTLNLIEFAK